MNIEFRGLAGIAGAENACLGSSWLCDILKGGHKTPVTNQGNVAERHQLDLFYISSAPPSPVEVVVFLPAARGPPDLSTTCVLAHDVGVIQLGHWLVLPMMRNETPCLARLAATASPLGPATSSSR